jgi:pilus assembly protein CpaE
VQEKMIRRTNVLLASRSSKALASLGAVLANVPEITLSKRLLGDGQADPLAGLETAPDVLVLRFDAESVAELSALAGTHPGTRPPLILVGPAGNPDALRLAVRSGARDFLVEPVDPSEFVAAVERLLNEPVPGHAPHEEAHVTVVLGAAGGVGASFVACNLAHALATEGRQPTLLMDLDLNDAPLASFLDLSPERGLLEALAEVKSLDEHAIYGYVTKHRSGLHLMGAPSKVLVSDKDLDTRRFSALMNLIAKRYDHIVVDASHGAGALALTALTMARSVVVVVQQSVVQLRQAARLIRLMTGEIGIPESHLLVVVNRYTKRSTVALDDIRRTLARERLMTLPNKYETALSSIDGGIPVLEMDRSSAVAQAIIELQMDISGRPHPEHKSFLRRALPMLSGD